MEAVDIRDPGGDVHLTQRVGNHEGTGAGGQHLGREGGGVHLEDGGQLRGRRRPLALTQACLVQAHLIERALLHQRQAGVVVDGAAAGLRLGVAQPRVVGELGMDEGGRELELPARVGVGEGCGRGVLPVVDPELEGHLQSADGAFAVVDQLARAEGGVDPVHAGKDEV